jgi:hypothetical protein
LTDCATLQEAVLAWQRLAPEQKIRATVKVIGGPVYTAHGIDRLHYGPKPGGRCANDMKIVTAETIAELLSRADASLPHPSAPETMMLITFVCRACNQTRNYSLSIAMAEAYATADAHAAEPLN